MREESKQRLHHIPIGRRNGRRLEALQKRIEALQQECRQSVATLALEHTPWDDANLELVGLVNDLSGDFYLQVLR